VAKDPISKMIDLIEKERKILFYRFQDDFLRHSLGLSSLSPIEKEVYLAWIYLHAQEESIVGIILTVEEKGAALGYLSSLLDTLTTYCNEEHGGIRFNDRYF